jgi:chromosome segregation ATPase
VKALEADKNRLKIEINSLKKTISQLRIEIETHRQENNRMQGDLVIVSNQVSEVQSAPSSAFSMDIDISSSRKYKDMDGAYKKLKMEKDILDSEMTSLRQRLTRTTAELSNTNREKNILDGQSAWKDKRIKEMEEALNELQSKNRVCITIYIF